MGRADIRRDAARGVVAAMAMTGFRRLSVGLGLLEETPPEVMAEQAKVLRPALERVPERLRGEAVELGHWLYGAAGGAVYGALCGRVSAGAGSAPHTASRSGPRSRRASSRCSASSTRRSER